MGLIEIFFTQTVTIRPFLRQGPGEPIYGNPETRRCRLERGATLRSVNKGQRGVINATPSGARMYCVGRPIPAGSIVEHGDRDFVVTDCRIMNGFRDDHLEVTLQ